MTVSAFGAKDLPSGANVDLRAEPSIRAGTHIYDGPDAVTRWHSHNLHEVEYALQGVTEIESADGHYLLPPQQAAWIPAGLVHRTTLRQVRSVAVFFDPRMVPVTNDRVRILAVSPVLREMYKYGRRWPIDRPASDPMADSFFRTLAHLTRDALAHEAPLSLPTSDDPMVSAIMEYTRAHLVDVTVARACAAVGTSERTMRRRFESATGISWSQYLLTARLLRAMALLTDSQRSVLNVANEVGFASFSAFTRAFKRFVGEAPSAYRKRVLSARA
jgi:AraC-like DNA-binding protein